MAKLASPRRRAAGEKRGTKGNRHGRSIVSLLLAGVAAVGVGYASTGALFTDSDSLGNNTFTTGSVDITAAKTSGVDLTMANMVPGSVKYGEITVSNSGSMALRYAVTQAATNADGKNLAGAINLEVKAGLASCNDAGWASGTVLNAAGSKFSTATVLGDVASGNQAGDRILNAGNSEKLCFRATLPTNAANTLQGATTTGTFTFAAEQTANN